MATEKTLKTRVVLKHDTEENWITAGKATNPFIPKKGEVIIYDPDGTHTYSRQKVGDGIKNINELPFLGATVGTADSSESLSKIQYTAESAIPTTPEQGVEYAITDLIGYGDLDADLQAQIDHMGNTGPTGPTGPTGATGPTGPGSGDITDISLSSYIESVSYDTTNGIAISSNGTITTDITDLDITASYNVPLVAGKYISMSADLSNSKVQVAVNDTALAQDYYKINRGITNTIVIPFWNGQNQSHTELTENVVAYSAVQRNNDGNTRFNTVGIDFLSSKGDFTANKVSISDLRRSSVKEDSEIIIDKTSTNTGTLPAVTVLAARQYPQIHIQYDNQTYYRMDPPNTSSGTMNFVNTDASGNQKCFQISTSDFSWKIIDLPKAKIGTSSSSENLSNITYLTNSDVPASPATNTEYAITDAIGYGDLDSELQAKVDAGANAGSNLSNYLPLSGGTINGDITFAAGPTKITNNSINTLSAKAESLNITDAVGIVVINGFGITRKTHGGTSYGTIGGISDTTGTSSTIAASLTCLKDNYLPLSGGTMTGTLIGSSIFLSNDIEIDQDDGTGIEILSSGSIQFFAKDHILDSNFTGLSDSKGTSSTIAASQKCLNDNYVAKTDLPSNLLKYQIITSTSQIGTDANTAYLILE